ncbi:MAG: hypothetical protein NXH91_15945 [Phyllobacteriaceae bacterium]|jgi:hypothetical protein|nr:hypothetical protein [Phyllobacteriaceae bacterium]
MGKSTQTPTVSELAEPAPPQGDPDYLVWTERKIRASLEADKAAPERRKALDDVMKERGAR